MKKFSRFWLALMKEESGKKPRWRLIKLLIQIAILVWRIVEFFSGDGTS